MTERQATAWERTGGTTALFLSSFPVAVLVVVNSLAGLPAGLWSAVGTTVAFTVLRVARRQPLRPVVGAVVGIAISSWFASRSGSARDFFLPDIWYSAVIAGLLVLSTLVRRPLVGVLWSALNRAPASWRQDGPSRRAYTLATLAVAAVFGARFVVQRWLYDQDQAGWLAFAKIAMGYPLTLLGLAAVAWAVRRADQRARSALMIHIADR